MKKVVLKEEDIVYLIKNYLVRRGEKSENLPNIKIKSKKKFILFGKQYFEVIF